MVEDQSIQARSPRKVTRIIRRAVKGLAILLLVGIVVVAVGAAGIWGHFWDFRVGDPTSESCGNCHVMEPYVESLATTDLLGGSHADQDIACTDCHEYDFDHQLNDTIAYLGGEVRGEGQQPLEPVRYEMDFCFECHEHGSYDQIIWRTMDLGVTDPQAKGHDANPHQSPHYSELECNLCHRVHTPSILYCWECHAYDFGNPQFSREAYNESVLEAAPEATPELTPQTTPEVTAETTSAN